ncbi:MAG: hypothetical protein DDT23_01350 [candidate division WS2 bacterium]|nr:hypothetical protein [Candidatus Lithacetigena glycinireducens]
MRPMLAAQVDFSKLIYPLWASPKIDGIRCLMLASKALTRNLKPIPNLFIRSLLEEHGATLDYFDGELIAGSFSSTSSSIMSFSGQPEFKYVIFDRITSGSYETRFLQKLELRPLPPFVEYIETVLVNSEAELLEHETLCLRGGYEGVMLRRADGLDIYKYGRSTVREAYLLKLKRFTDAEAVVVGFEEQLHNDNIQERDELGYSKRSSARDGMLPMDTLGALIVESATFGRFNLGTGFSAEQRKEIWDSKDTYMSKLVKFKYQEIGTDSKPRFPVFLSFRDINDL